MAIYTSIYLTYALKNTSTEAPFAIVGDEEIAALKTLYEISESSIATDAKHTRVPAPPPRVPIAPNPSTHPPTHNYPTRFLTQSDFSGSAVTALLTAPDLTTQIKYQLTQKIPE